MGKKMIPSIINAFNKNTYDWANVDKKDGGFDYLLAFDSNLFHIACDMSFIQNELNVYGIGSGGQFATGYLYSLDYTIMNQDRAVEIAQKAVEISSILDINTCPPIQIAIQKRKVK
jgi:ATP-dependent protease HslVU (ClpYQ) peptidase subunit